MFTRNRGAKRAEMIQGRVAGSRGQALVEFALVTPLLLVLVLGVIDFGRGISAWATLAHSAREGARAGIHLEATDDDIRSAVRRIGYIVSDIPDEDIVIEPSVRVAQQPVSVTVTYEFRPITPFFSGLWGGESLLLTGAARMKVE